MSCRAHRLVLASLLLVPVVGCDSGDPEPDPRFRCAGGVPTGLVGLDRVSMSGTPLVDGAYPSVFSNGVVELAGTYDLEGDAISGGEVTISGNVLPKGKIIEGAAPIVVDDPKDDVAAAKAKNDNAKIPTIKVGSKWVSPVSNYALSLNAKQSITLASGTYYFESISINGQATLNVSGDVVIYLNGPATFNGGSATNPSSDELRVVSSSTSEIKVNGGGTTDMHVFAPNATVRFSGTQGFRGTALGKELIISGTADLEVTGNLALTDGYIDCLPEDPVDPENPSGDPGDHGGLDGGGSAPPPPPE